MQREWSRSMIWLRFLLYIGVFTDPIRTLVDFTEQFQNGYTGFERFQEIMNIEPEIQDANDAVALTDVKGTIDFEKCFFSVQRQSGEGA